MIASRIHRGSEIKVSLDPKNLKFPNVIRYLSNAKAHEIESHISRYSYLIIKKK